MYIVIVLPVSFVCKKTFEKLFIICFQGGGLASTNGLQRHIPRVSRAITKVINHVENLDQVTGYLEMLGKIHQQIGVEVNKFLKINRIIISKNIHAQATTNWFNI